MCGLFCISQSVDASIDDLGNLEVDMHEIEHKVQELTDLYDTQNLMVEVVDKKISDLQGRTFLNY